MITIFLVLASVHKCQAGFSLANISFTQNENASCSTFFKGHWSQDIFLKRLNLSCFVHFKKQYPNDLLSCQKLCWFSFDMLSIICIIVLRTFLAFIYFASHLHICYLTSCSFHPILYIGMLMLCLFLAPWQHFFKTCLWTNLQGLIVFLQSTCCMQMNLCVFFSVNCLTCVLFTSIYPIPV